MRFPTDLQIQDDTEYVKITPAVYGGSLQRDEKQKVIPSSESIILYMPAQLQFSNKQKWNTANFTGIGKTLLKGLGFLLEDNALETLQNGDLLEQKGQALGNQLGQGFGQYARKFGAAQAAGFLEQIGGNFGIQGVNSNAITGGIRGQILNPQTELFYEAPALRDWAFTYTFIPKSRKDEIEMQKIVKTLKKESTPKRTGNEWLEIPKVFVIQFMKGGTENKNVPKLKPAALTDITLSLNPGLDYWTSFNSGGPVSLALNLIFSEIEIIYSEDHDEGNLGY